MAEIRLKENESLESSFKKIQKAVCQSWRYC